MSKSVPCICIDDKNKPDEIPKDKWVVKLEEYHINHIFIMRNQGNIQGCELSEFDISMHKPYNCYRLSRFAFTQENLLKLIELVIECSIINDIPKIQVDELIEKIKKDHSPDTKKKVD